TGELPFWQDVIQVCTQCGKGGIYEIHGYTCPWENGLKNKEQNHEEDQIAPNPVCDDPVYFGRCFFSFRIGSFYCNIIQQILYIAIPLYCFGALKLAREELMPLADIIYRFLFFRI